MIDQADPIEPMVDAFVEHEAMEDAAAYLRRGRPYAGLADAALNDLWVSSFRTWLPARADQTAFTRWGDAGAELRMRGADLPFHAVRAEMDAARAELRAAADHRDEGLRDRLRAFLNAINGPSN